MTDAEAQMLRTRAKSAALKMGANTERAEELAQDVVLRFMQTGFKGQTVSQAVVDAMRATDGRKGQPKYEETAAMRNAMPIEDAPEPGHETNPTAKLEIDERLSVLTRVERAVYILSNKNEMTRQEVADLFGLTESRISQVMTEAQRKLGEPVLTRPKVKRTEKACSNCKRVQPLDRFSFCRGNSDGYHHRCKVCDSKVQKVRREKNRMRNAALILLLCLTGCATARKCDPAEITDGSTCRIKRAFPSWVPAAPIQN